MALSFCGVETDSLGKEQKAHGTALFPLACYDDKLDDHDIPWHWHEELEYIVILEGTCDVSVASKKIKLQTGQGIFINSGVLHMLAQPKKGTSLVIHSLVFHPRLIGGNTDSIFWQQLISPCLQRKEQQYEIFDASTTWGQTVLDCFHTVWRAAVVEIKDYELLSRYQLSLAQKQINNHFTLPASKTAMQNLMDSERIKTMLQFIEENYGEDISLTQLAKTAAISESSCLRCFKKILGKAPLQYLKEYRLDKAAELLVTTNLKSHEIGDICGFHDMSYFTKAFKEQTGMTPIEYRYR